MSNNVFTPLVYPRIGAGAADGAPGLAAERARGYSDGYAEGLRRAAATLDATDADRSKRASDAAVRDEARVAQAVAALGAAVAALNRRFAPVVEDCDAVLVAASLELAEAVVGREVTGGRAAAQDALNRALSAIPNEQTARVRLNPADAAQLESHALPAHVTIVADPAIASGDVIVGLEEGWLDARIASALERAREIVTGERS